jgi:hypothetical protein
LEVEVSNPEQLELDLDNPNDDTQRTYNPNTHFLQPKITGYRQLSPNEVELINEIKRLAEQAGVMVSSLEGSTIADPRWVAIARTQLQQAFMALTRSVARPASF